MSLHDEPTEINEVAISSLNDRMVVATNAGVYVSDTSRGAFTRTLGMTRLRETELSAFTVAIDPTDPH